MIRFKIEVFSEGWEEGFLNYDDLMSLISGQVISMTTLLNPRDAMSSRVTITRIQDAD